MKTLTSLALVLAFSSVLLSAQTSLSDDAAARLIARVQQTPASQLDPALPRIPFEKWLRSQIGSEAAIGWAVRTADVRYQRDPWVEADVSIQGRPGIVIMIAVSRKPKFQSLEFMRAGEDAEFPHLRDLPDAVSKARGRR